MYNYFGILYIHYILVNIFLVSCLT